MNVYWVYADSVDNGDYVAAQSPEDAIANSAALMRRPAGDFVARYVLTASNPEESIAGLWAERERREVA